jgi:hypothetical protein
MNTYRPSNREENNITPSVEPVLSPDFSQIGASLRDIDVKKKYSPKTQEVKRYSRRAHKTKFRQYGGSVMTNVQLLQVMISIIALTLAAVGIGLALG